jgi:hypothetical protein
LEKEREKLSAMIAAPSTEESTEAKKSNWNIDED